MRQHLLHKLPLVESHNVILFSYRLERLYHKMALLVKKKFVLKTSWGNIKLQEN